MPHRAHVVVAIALAAVASSPLSHHVVAIALAAEPPRCRRRCPRGTLTDIIVITVWCVVVYWTHVWRDGVGLHVACMWLSYVGRDGLRVAVFFGRARPARWAFLSCVSNSLLLNGCDHSSHHTSSETNCDLRHSPHTARAHGNTHYKGQDAQLCPAVYSCCDASHTFCSLCSKSLDPDAARSPSFSAWRQSISVDKSVMSFKISLAFIGPSLCSSSSSLVIRHMV